MEFEIEENRQFNRRKEDSNQMLLDIIDKEHGNQI